MADGDAENGGAPANAINPSGVSLNDAASEIAWAEGVINNGGTPDPSQLARIQQYLSSHPGLALSPQLSAALTGSSQTSQNTAPLSIPGSSAAPTALSADGQLQQLPMPPAEAADAPSADVTRDDVKKRFTKDLEQLAWERTNTAADAQRVVEKGSVGADVMPTGELLARAERMEGKIGSIVPPPSERNTIASFGALMSRFEVFDCGPLAPQLAYNLGPPATPSQGPANTVDSPIV